MPPGQVNGPRQLGSGDSAMPATAVAGEIRLDRVIEGRDGGNEQGEQREEADQTREAEASPWRA